MLGVKAGAGQGAVQTLRSQLLCQAEHWRANQRAQPYGEVMEKFPPFIHLSEQTQRQFNQVLKEGAG